MQRFIAPVVEAAVVSGRVPRSIVNAAFAVSGSVARSFGRVAGSSQFLELANILEAMRHFAASRFDAASLATYGGELAPLGESNTAGRCLSFNEPTFEALWVLEGLGYRYAKLALQAKGNRLLDLGRATSLPVRHQGIFHVGSTIALAEDCMRRAITDPAADSGDAVHSYFEICREQAPETLWGIEAESLGFVVVTLFPRMLERAIDVVSTHHTPLRPFFWHGVGRALYLNHPLALGGVGRSWRALLGTVRASPDAADEASALAGYGWALGLVNLRQPLVIHDRARFFESSDWDTGQLRSGVAEAVLCWLRWKGWDEKPESIRTSAPVQGQAAKDWCGLATTVLDCLPPPSPVERLHRRTYGEMLGPLREDISASAAL